MRILLIDNFDSFTYNLVDYLEQNGADVEVIRNNDQRCITFKINDYDGLVLSPGPNRPEDAGYLMDAIAYSYGRIPILGVCLGHQAIGQYLGARLIHAPQPMHGKTSFLELSTKHYIWDSISTPIEIMRYHSLVLDLESLPPDIHILAVTEDDGSLMAYTLPEKDVVCLQFHPESIGTIDGILMLKNWLHNIQVKTHAPAL